MSEIPHFSPESPIFFPESEEFRQPTKKRKCHEKAGKLEKMLLASSNHVLSPSSELKGRHFRYRRSNEETRPIALHHVAGSTYLYLEGSTLDKITGNDHEVADLISIAIKYKGDLLGPLIFCNFSRLEANSTLFKSFKGKSEEERVEIEINHLGIDECTYEHVKSILDFCQGAPLHFPKDGKPLDHLKTYLTLAHHWDVKGLAKEAQLSFLSVTSISEDNWKEAKKLVEDWNATILLDKVFYFCILRGVELQAGLDSCLSPQMGSMQETDFLSLSFPLDECKNFIKKFGKDVTALSFMFAWNFSNYKEFYSFVLKSTSNLNEITILFNIEDDTYIQEEVNTNYDFLFNLICNSPSQFKKIKKFNLEILSAREVTAFSKMVEKLKLPIDELNLHLTSGEEDFSHTIAAINKLHPFMPGIATPGAGWGVKSLGIHVDGNLSGNWELFNPAQPIYRISLSLKEEVFFSESSENLNQEVERSAEKINIDSNEEEEFYLLSLSYLKNLHHLKFLELTCPLWALSPDSIKELKIQTLLLVWPSSNYLSYFSQLGSFSENIEADFLSRIVKAVQSMPNLQHVLMICPAEIQIAINEEFSSLRPTLTFLQDQPFFGRNLPQKYSEWQIKKSNFLQQFPNRPAQTADLIPLRELLQYGSLVEIQKLKEENETKWKEFLAQESLEGAELPLMHALFSAEENAAAVLKWLNQNEPDAFLELASRIDKKGRNFLHNYTSTIPILDAFNWFNKNQRELLKNSLIASDYDGCTVFHLFFLLDHPLSILEWFFIHFPEEASALLLIKHQTQGVPLERIAASDEGVKLLQIHQKALFEGHIGQIASAYFASNPFCMKSFIEFIDSTAQYDELRKAELRFQAIMPIFEKLTRAEKQALIPSLLYSTLSKEKLCELALQQDPINFATSINSVELLIWIKKYHPICFEENFARSANNQSSFVIHAFLNRSTDAFHWIFNQLQTSELKALLNTRFNIVHTAFKGMPVYGNLLHVLVAAILNGQDLWKELEFLLNSTDCAEEVQKAIRERYNQNQNAPEHLSPIVLTAASIRYNKITALNLLNQFALQKQQLFTEQIVPVIKAICSSFTFTNPHQFFHFIHTDVPSDQKFALLKFHLYLHNALLVLPSYLQQNRFHSLADQLFNQLFSGEGFFQLIDYQAMTYLFSNDIIVRHLAGTRQDLIEAFLEKIPKPLSLEQRLLFLPFLPPVQIHTTIQELTIEYRDHMLHSPIIEPELFEQEAPASTAISQCHQTWVSQIEWRAGQSEGATNTLLGLVEKVYRKISFRTIAIAASDPGLSDIIYAALRALSPIQQMVALPQFSKEQFTSFLSLFPIGQQAAYLAMGTKEQKHAYLSALNCELLLTEAVLKWPEFKFSIANAVNTLLPDERGAPRQLRKLKEILVEQFLQLKQAQRQFEFFKRKLLSRDDFSNEETLIAAKITPISKQFEEVLAEYSLLETKIEKHAVKIEEVPNEFLCPISGVIMTDPVRITDGTEQAYERSAIEKWFKEKRDSDQPLTSPLTNRPLNSDQLVPDEDLRKRIENFQKDEEKHA